MTRLDEILFNMEGDWYADPNEIVSKSKKEIVNILLELTERISWQDPVDGSWLIEPKQIREEIRKL